MTTSDESAARNATLNAALQFIEFLRENPELEIPYEFRAVSLWVDTKEDVAKWANALPKPQTKDYTGNYFYLEAKVGEFPVTISSGRKTVCVARVVGTETYQKPVYSEPTYVEDTRDVIEWECDPILKD